MTPKQSQRLIKKIADLKRALAAEKRKFGGYDDSRGLRYLPTRYYLQLADYKAGLAYTRWFAKAFPDDIGLPDGCNSNCRFLVLASGMNKKPTLTFTEEEYIALARQKYNELKALKDKPTFYDYEKSFEEIWLDLGRQVLEKSLSRVPTDRRKKKA